MGWLVPLGRTCRRHGTGGIYGHRAASCQVAMLDSVCRTGRATHRRSWWRRLLANACAPGPRKHLSGQRQEVRGKAQETAASVSKGETLHLFGICTNASDARAHTRSAPLRKANGADGSRHFCGAANPAEHGARRRAVRWRWICRPTRRHAEPTRAPPCVPSTRVRLRVEGRIIAMLTSCLRFFIPAVPLVLRATNHFFFFFNNNNNN